MRPRLSPPTSILQRHRREYRNPGATRSIFQSLSDFFRNFCREIHQVWLEATPTVQAQEHFKDWSERLGHFDMSSDVDSSVASMLLRDASRLRFSTSVTRTSDWNLDSPGVPMISDLWKMELKIVNGNDLIQDSLLNLNQQLK